MATETEDALAVPEWEQYPWLLHGFSQRANGFSTVYGPDELNLGFTKDDDPACVRRNRARFLQGVTGGTQGVLATVRQVHGTVIRTLREVETGAAEADGTITGVAGVMPAILVADCVPVLVADTRLRVVGAFHAGWRGTVGGIVEAGIERLREEFGSRVEDLIGAVGPAIGPCCYQVGDEVREAFEARFPDAAELFRGDRLDLWEANRRQMLGAGMRRESVIVVGECTACTRVDGRLKYFSHRAERGFTGRGMGMVGIAGCGMPGAHPAVG